MCTIYLNCAMICHFNWFVDAIKSSNSIHIIDTIKWGIRDADLMIHCDALLSGLGFVNLNA